MTQEFLPLKLHISPGWHFLIANLPLRMMKIAQWQTPNSEFLLLEYTIASQYSISFPVAGRLPPGLYLSSSGSIFLLQKFFSATRTDFRSRVTTLQMHAATSHPSLLPLADKFVSFNPILHLCNEAPPHFQMDE